MSDEKATTKCPLLLRRDFLKIVGAAGLTAVGVDRVEAAADDTPADPYAVLVDTTRCLGCRNCELVCAEANGLPEPDLDDSVVERERSPSETQWAVVNRYDTEAGEVWVKRQCMHCVQPACAAACLTKAMLKTDDGPVVWRESRCMGCRFCMVSCPFDMPRFEYDSAMPRIQKCNLCFERAGRGEPPVCVQECLGEALTFGRRSELIAEARRRIYAEPGRYVDRIYGEHEAGGTCWLYLSAVPFDQIGFRTDLSNRPYPELTQEFLYAVPVVLTLAPAFLLALSRATKSEEPAENEDATDDEHELQRTA